MATPFRRSGIGASRTLQCGRTIPRGNHHKGCFPCRMSLPSLLRVRLSAGKDQLPSQIYLVSYPKFIFLYPTFWRSLVASHCDAVSGGEGFARGCALRFPAFLGIFTAKPRRADVRLSAGDVADAVLLSRRGFDRPVGALFPVNPQLLPSVTNVIKEMQPYANAHFYFTLTICMAVIYVGVMVAVRFDYWEVPTERIAPSTTAF